MSVWRTRIERVIAAYLRVKDEFRPIRKVHVPDADEAVRVVDRRGLLVVRGDTEFGELKKASSESAVM